MELVGLAVVTYKDNFGSALQTYATQRVLNDLGYETRIFDIDGVHREINRRKIRFYLTRVGNRDERQYLLDNLTSRTRKKAKVSSDAYANQMRVRHRKYEEFNAHNLKFFPKVKGFTALSGQSSACEHVVVGSDQLWRPSNIAGGFFTLDFVPDSVNKVALSTSFGVSELPKTMHRRAKHFLNRMDSISVRETSGQSLVKQLAGRNATVVCDPTMLLNARAWMDIQEEQAIVDGDYVLTYFMGEERQHRDFAIKLARETGCKTVGLLHGATYVAQDEGVYDIEPYDVGPAEFINLVRHARYVCTDSFHGTVFSILNNTKFFTFRRFADDSAFSTNDRLHTLLGWTGLANRLLRGDEDVASWAKARNDWDYAMEMVGAKRLESMKFLSTALERNGRG